MENTQPTLTEILHAARQHRRTLEMKRGDFQREARRSAERNIEHYTDIIFAADIRAARSAEYGSHGTHWPRSHGAWPRPVRPR